MIKTFQSCLDLLKVYAFYVKLESSCCRIYCVNLPGSINRELDSTDRNSGRTFFCRIFQLNPSSFDMQGFMFCPRYKKENPSHASGCSLCCVCESFVRLRNGCLYTYLGLSRTGLCQELVDRFNCCFKSLKIYKRECLGLLGIQERSNLWTRSYHVVVVVSFLLKVAIGCQWSKSLLCKLQFFYSGFNFTLRIARLNPPQVFYWFGFPGLSYCCILYFSHFTII